MAQQLHYKIFNSAAALPPEWDNLSLKNIFLSRAYLSVLEQSAPDNVEAHFIGIFANDTLCAIALAQYINLYNVTTFTPQQKDFCLKEYLFKKFSSRVLILGNNMLTGQNAYLIDGNSNEADVLKAFENALLDIKSQYRCKGITINLIAVKDFNEDEFPDFKAAGYHGYYRFSTQPNMIFDIRSSWRAMDNYLSDLTTKYRTQYNRARKKAEGIEKYQLNAEEIKDNNPCIQRLYLTVAGNAGFNTFHLPENHFYIFKQQLKDNFRFYGYFLEGKLIGFNTLIKNGKDMDTYFLGYDASLQKQKMLYLNMLYDMAGYGIKKQFSHIIYGRTAMEIKSSIGARAEKVYGLIKHTNPLVNLFMARFFIYFDPVVEWKERSPFKN
ncbi:8-amino-7-oxononanoate synthase [Flavobacterium rhizosphaerae]|uniref:8-amino-7-oxononanoate synthase n=1 Tax=Flavobacterium rhizosphaerae TaxID=3163298 RepID=A0ABW8YXG4_9FLAO